MGGLVSPEPNPSRLQLTEELCSADECLIEKHWSEEDVCAYVRCNKDACEGGGYLQWSAYVKCEYRDGLRIFLIIIGILYLLFLFIIMTYVADDFFSPAIAGIVKHLRMSESIAGVTFLAFGNGAPDVFGSIASVIASPKPKADLAIGDILGGGIFVTTVVLSAIIFTKSFRIAALATTRDIVFFLIADIFIAICFICYDHVYTWMPLTFLGIYALYVISVILMRLNSMRRKRLRALRKIQEVEEGSSTSGTIHHHTHKISTVINFFMDYAHVIKMLHMHKFSTNTKFAIPTAHKSSDSESLFDWDGDDEGEEAEFVIAHRHVYTSYDQASLALSDMEEIHPTSWKSWDWVRDLLHHIRPYPTQEDLSELNYFSKVVRVIATLPLFFMKITIPSNEMSYCKPLLILHCFASVQFALFAIQLSQKSPFHGSPGLWLYGLAVSAVLSILALIFTPLSREQKYYKEIYSYLGFLMSICWIYVTSSEIINVITMIGVATGVSQELLGLTIMAWSNCIGDVVADIAVVKQGYPKMAMAAAIGGPLFNLLIGFGLPFTIACLQGKDIELQITPVYKLLMLFLAISLITSLIAIFVQKFKVHWQHAVVLLIVFVAFLIFIILTETNVLVWN
ncbi:unnamed protein product [Caenorhabditis bovis]|uniref:Sodium/calcium exchanger membrane region domain-containing protein n=1 Tax=Caenorhabditis bovis TaxID=2654633 RepID=A0A8S1E9G8_9PELO|nr:unnamed protein product [Caenorhabditis bovis]